MKKIKKKVPKKTVSAKKPVKPAKPKKNVKSKGFVKGLVEDIKLPAMNEIKLPKPQPKQKAFFRLFLIVLAGAILFFGYLIYERIGKQPAEITAPVAETAAPATTEPAPVSVPKPDPSKEESATGGGPMNFSAAIKYCKAKKMRLPSLAELKEIQKNANESLKKGNQYWSSTKEKKGDFVNVVSMASGSKNSAPKTSRFQVICVKK